MCSPGKTATYSYPTNTCSVICGDGLRYTTEVCDDGNTNNYDGCNSACGVEKYFVCIGGSLTTKDTCYCDLSVVSATFSAGWTRIEVTFSYPVQISAAGADSCGTVLGSTLHSLLGVGSSCSTSDNKLTINLGTSSKFTASTKLSINAGSLTITGVSCNNQAFSDISVSPDSVSCIPAVSIVAPTYLSLCVSLKLSGVASATTCGSLEGAEFAWTLVDVAPEWTEKASYVVVVQGQLSAASGTSVTIDSSNLLASKEYTFKLTVTNAVGGSGAATVSVTTNGEITPTLNLIGPTMQYYYAYQHIVLRAEAEMAACANSVTSYSTNDLRFKWTLDSSSDSAVQALAQFTQTPQNLSYIEVLQYVLAPGRTYTVGVTAYVSKDPDVSTKLSARIYIKNSPLVALIRGENRTVLPGQAFSVDGSQSFDSSLPRGKTDSALQYSWECTVPETRAACKFANGSAVAEALQGCSTKELYASDFAAPVSMELRLIVKKDTRTADTISGITILSALNDTAEVADAPYVLFPLSNGLLRANPDSTVVLSAVYPGEAAKDLNFWWNCVEGPCEKVRFLSPISQLAATVYIPSTGNSSVTFSLSAQRGNGTVANSTVTLGMNTPPLSGSISVSPSSGYALSTRFEIAAVGWTDPDGDLPLQYQFEASEHADFSESVALSDQILQNYVQSMLWKPQGDSTTIYIRLRVYDAAMAMTESVTTVEVYYDTDPLKYLSYITRLNSVYEGLTTNNIEFLIRVFAVRFQRY